MFRMSFCAQRLIEHASCDAEKITWQQKLNTFITNGCMNHSLPPSLPPNYKSIFKKPKPPSTTLMRHVFSDFFLHVFFFIFRLGWCFKAFFCAVPCIIDSVTCWAFLLQSLILRLSLCFLLLVMFVVSFRIQCNSLGLYQVIVIIPRRHVNFMH